MTTSIASPQQQTLFIAMETSNKKWRLAFSDGQRVRQVGVEARNLGQWTAAVERAKEKLGLRHDGPIKCCYEAGRDGFWIHRWLTSRGVDNLVVDPASIEVNRRYRRAKTDRLDAEKLVRMLIRYAGGERLIWRVAHVPAEGEEDERRLHRELERLKKERTGHRNRIGSLLALQGIGECTEEFEAIHRWDGQTIPAGARDELRREHLRLRQVEEQIEALEEEQLRRLTEPKTVGDHKAAKLYRLRAIGPVTAWVLGKEFFGWRQFRNRRQVGALAGLTGTPYDSGDQERDQGISKAGNKRVRYMMVELAWIWLRYQPDSELSQWFWKRFGYGNRRMRRIGIVALARKLLVALWKYLEWDLVPAGAVMAKR
jgi:transposase